MDLYHRHDSIPTDTDNIEICEVSYSYKDTEERPEQTFSPALNEPYNPLMNLIYDQKSNSTSDINTSDKQKETAFELNSSKNKISVSEDNNKQTESLIGLNKKGKDGIKEARKNSSTRIPIEEKLRLKDLEREVLFFLIKKFNFSQQNLHK